MEKSVNDLQVGGEHYKGKKIQPWDFIVDNDLGFLEGNVVKYVSRFRQKNGVEDLKKAKHYLEKLIEVETLRAKERPPSGAGLSAFSALLTFAKNDAVETTDGDVLLGGHLFEPDKVKVGKADLTCRYCGAKFSEQPDKMTACVSHFPPVASTTLPPAEPVTEKPKWTGEQVVVTSTPPVKAAFTGANWPVSGSKPFDGSTGLSETTIKVKESTPPGGDAGNKE